MYKVYNKFLDLTDSMAQWYLLGAGILVVTIIGLVTRDFLAVIATLIACGVIYFGSVAKKQEEVDLFINDADFQLGEESYEWSKCVGWCVNDLGDALEYVIQTNNLIVGALYFYVDEEQEFNHDLVVSLGQHIPYSTEIANANEFKTWCKRTGIL